jgi:hypothetical protein
MADPCKGPSLQLVCYCYTHGVEMYFKETKANVVILTLASFLFPLGLKGGGLLLRFHLTILKSLLTDVKTTGL